MNISELIGKTIVEIIGGLQSDDLVFVCDDGSKYQMYHSQDCCESVYLEDIAGDLNDLIGTPILRAEESTNDENPPGVTPPEYQDYFMWTFYKLDTAKGGVTLRWYGDSNGYYGVGVDFAKIA